MTMQRFVAIPKHQLYPDEPPHAVAVWVESTGDWDEFLGLSTRDGEEVESFIALSPEEARQLVAVINRWLA